MHTSLLQLQHLPSKRAEVVKASNACHPVKILDVYAEAGNVWENFVPYNKMGP